ncbi:hypothetical protein BJ973_003786 [Actinoplanes tereljensis]|uniref:IPT/TIG domain-containing protein n=1 Tax=Paractinoplanes tereljensis TaxID=571912 RepID=A0A919NUK1_9ACTN|nr:hypothetical protein [Actinoplanes tereljensis]GIF25509.1 hypothetical protein Ate02nite_82390 [Actinoplanes tereljensis]
MNVKRYALAATVVAVVAGGGVAAVGIANADTTPTPSNPYIVAPPGASLSSGDATAIQVAGRTFSGTAVPANATGAVVKLSSVNPSSSGVLTVYTTGTRPGSPTVSYRRGQNVTGTATVPLDSRGRLSVYSSARTKFTLQLQSYTTPTVTPPAPTCTATISTIAPSTKTLTQVGGSIRAASPAGATDFGSVTLPAGTYDARVIGGFTGFNNTDTWLPSGVFLTGTMTVVKGAEINSSFTNNVTAGGVMIPKSDSATLTQDPTLAISTFLILDTETEVHIKLFAYASNSGTAGSGQVKANVQSAQFRKVC